MKKPSLTDRQREIIRLLGLPIFHRHNLNRTIYQVGRWWYIDYATFGLPTHTPFDTPEVKMLVADGFLESVYPECDEVYKLKTKTAN